MKKPSVFCFAIALGCWLSLLLQPVPALAGKAPLDNTGRIQCDANGLISKDTLSSTSSSTVPHQLQVGETKTIPAICPAERYFPSGVLITPGAKYQIDSQGLWKDGWFVIGPQGWRGLLLEAWNRIPWRPFFELSGSIGQSEQHLFSIGRSRNWQAPSILSSAEENELFLFANDWPGKMGNNRAVPDRKGGPLRVSIRRLQ
jgi:hypothetical protein